MSRPSEPLLEWMRSLLKTRGINTANLAKRAGLPRNRVRQVLAGQADLTVDELMAIAGALELQVADFPVELPEVDTDGSAPNPREDDTANAHPMDPFSSHHKQLFEAAFALGVDFGFTVDPTQLTDSGVPRHVLEAYDERMMFITLDAAYHEYNEPRIEEEQIQITLSFDALYTCRFPYAAISQIIFNPAAEPPEAPSETEGDEAGSHLRLVT